MLDDQPRPIAAEEGAVFAPVRVRGSRRPRILASLVIVAVGALIAIGALDRAAAPPGPATAADATGAPAASPPAPIDALGGGARFVDLDIRPAGGDLFIHGDVFSLDVARVTVRLEDSAGNVAATRSVDIPGGSTAFRIGSVPRFDVQFTLGDEVQTDGFTVSTTALDSAGRTLTTLHQLIPRRQDVHLSRRFDPAFPSLVVVEASESGPIAVLATRRPSMVTVVGAVHLQQVTRILVTLQSLDGQPAGSASEVIPLSASDGKDHMPPLAFNIWLAVPAGLANRVLIVQTSAYDTRGLLLATTLAQLDPEL